MRKRLFLNQLAALLIGLMLSQAALACTTDAWNGGVTGSPLPGSPTPEGVSRVSGFCGMELDATGTVKDTSPVQESTVYARFYVLGIGISGTPVIFEAFANNDFTGSLLTVTFDGSSFVFNAGDGESVPIAGDPAHWNKVEMAWTSGVGMDVWVNSDSAGPPDDSIGAIEGPMESVMLGAISGLEGGTLTFDDYESHRDTLVGDIPIPMGDGNGDGNVNSGDIIAVINEYFNIAMSDDAPDCNRDGNVNSGDIICIINTYFGL